jgi:hypothetical protein
MAGGVEELLDMLYNMIQDAWAVPLGSDRCIVEREKVLDIIDEIKATLPVDLKQARTIVDARNEVINMAKREADGIKRQAEERARQMVSEEEVLITAKHKANDLLSAAEEKAREVRRVTNEYVEDAFKRTEEAIGEALSEVRQSRAKFRSAVSKPSGQGDAAGKQ